MKGTTLFISICVISLLYSDAVLGYDDQITHPAITEKAVKDVSALGAYLITTLGFPEGLNTRLPSNSQDSNRSIWKLLTQGATDEDHPPCQAANHFHNPLRPWDSSQMSDDANPLETPMAFAIAQGCAVAGWPAMYRKSNVTWATGYKSPSPEGFKYMFLSSESPLPINWDTARASYYSALTGHSASNRDTDFAATFSAFGHVLHLIQDMAVPAHVRNDFQSHLVSHGWGINDNYYNRYEYYVMKHNYLINAVQPVVPPDSNRRLTDFWDTNTYDGTNPSYSTAQGLAEFTNANFFSDFTIPFANPLVPVRPEHSFPQPGLDYYGNQYHLCNDKNENGQIVQYLSRSTCPTSGPIDHFLTASLLNTRDGAAYFFWTDDKVHDTYANELLPRAVGYSAGLLNYFFRGTITITLPNSGVYSSTTDTATGFTQVTFLAQNTTPSGEEMADGSIELVVKYRLAQGDPFHSIPVLTSDEFFYKVASEASGRRTIPINGPVELFFDLSGANAIPLWATDVYLQVVYHGKLGNEDGAVAVGFKDISEPTPIDEFNNMDKICINGAWYAAGSGEAYNALPASAKYWDYWAHDLKDEYLNISPTDSATDASPTNYTFYKQLVEAGTLYKSYILSDYNFEYSGYGVMEAKDLNDHNNHSATIKKATAQGIGVRNQEDTSNDQNFCQTYGLTAPCIVRRTSSFYTFRGVDIWGSGGFITDGISYPNNTDPNYIPCSWSDLSQ